MTFQTELRDRLESAAWRAGTASRDEALAADAVIDLHRVRRRRTVLGAGALTCLALAAVLVPGFGGRSSSDATTPPKPAVGTPSGPLVRGSLGADRSFTSAVRDLPWLDLGGTPPPPSGRTVVFAGDAAGYRWALVTAQTEYGPTGMWFTGPQGAAPGALQPLGIEPYTAELPAAVAEPDEGGATLLVLARPGDQVQVSPAAVIGAGGTARREYAPVRTEDGVAATRVAGVFAGTAARYRVIRDGSPVATLGFGGSYTSLPAIDDLARTAPLRPSAGAVSAAAVGNALQSVLTPTGLGPAEVHPVLLWATELATSSGDRLSVASVAATMPSGALVVSTGTVEDGGGGTPGCASTVYPAGTAAADVVLATSCILDLAGTPTQRSFVVSAPADASRVSLVDVEGTVLVQQPLVGGSAVIPDPGTVATAVVTRPGRPESRVAVANDSRQVLDPG